MKRMARSSGVVGAVAIVLACAACSDRDERRADEQAKAAGNAAADTAKAAGDAVANAGRAAGDAVANAGRAGDAAVETMDVKAALMKDSRVDASDINVDSDHVTKTVTLKGMVPTDSQKTIAEQIAIEKAVGYRVVNALTVGK